MRPLFEDKEVDLVYVASPHSHHYEHAKAALEHGKHVLCEKPMTVNEEQAKELFALAKERGPAFDGSHLDALYALCTCFAGSAQKRCNR